METLSASIGRGLRSPGFKFFIIAFLILLMLIPMLLVWAMIEDRSRSAKKVAQDIAQEWGDKQTINGPFLVVPYTASRTIGQGDKAVEQLEERHAIFLPAQTTIEASATPKSLRRSIYEITVYSSAMTVNGRFDAPNMGEVAPDAKTVRWGDALLAVSISDVSGLKSATPLKIDGAGERPFEPSVGLVPVGSYSNNRYSTMQGINARISSSPSAGAALNAFTFSFGLTLDGSSGLLFAPVARDTVVTMQSTWPHPSFTGSFLPVDRSVSDNGFTARWQIPHLARSVPQGWALVGSDNARDTPDQRMSEFNFGVDFYIPVDTYDLASRAAKYATMFLAVAFMTVLLMEIRSGCAVHAAQYVLVGIAILFFHVLLVALAEHIGFLPAYVIGSLATASMLALYIAMALGSWRKGGVMLAILLTLYALLYLVLRMEDYALLVGAVGGFIVLAVVMFATLDVDWSGRKVAQESV